MKPDQAYAQSPGSDLDGTIRSAVEAIAPLWPLDRFIAVNPFHGWTGTAFLETARKFQALAGASLFMRPSYYREAWQGGLLRSEHLRSALAELGSALTVDECRSGLDRVRHEPVRRPLLSDIIDSRRDLQHEPAWDDVITGQISRFCAAWFDRSMSDWRPCRGPSLYADWKSRIGEERGLALLMGDGDFLKRPARLSDRPRVVIGNVLAELALDGEAARDLLTSALLRINGWASWCAYLRWQSRLHGDDNRLMEELLAVRLAWERLLDDGRRDPSSSWQRWQSAWNGHPSDDDRAHVLAVWQRALELAYQMRLGAALSRGKPQCTRKPVGVQMAFCIDVRSEIVRRAIETESPGIQTLGFAGFFGLPIAYRALGTDAERPQLPGLFKPQYLVSDGTGDEPRDRAIAKRIAARLSRRDQTGPFRKLPTSAFTLVEAMGLGFAVKLLAKSLAWMPARNGRPGPQAPGARLRVGLRPRLPATLSLSRKADLAAGILEAMSLTGDFSRLVVLVGHGSRSANNPHAAGLDCGACGGQTGEVNVRLLAGLLNDAGLRDALRSRGLHIPADTHFLPALHNTTTDDFYILDGDDIPQSHRPDANALRSTLAAASVRARRERAPRLGLGELCARPEKLRKAMRKRALDWSQTRPEWGLANNAAFIVAPRSRTLGIDLEGRAFLHDYHPRRDADGRILESIMTGPMIVAAWINLQYYGSTVDNRRFGSGNKVLHNVVGGTIGVFEGNGGDLRTGLPMQSLHDGQRWMHTPQRLSVYVEAERGPLESVLHEHSLVRDLVFNDWVFLFRINHETGVMERHCRGRWLSADQDKLRAGR